MLQKIDNIINGNICPACDSRRLYRLSDNRLKCHDCSLKYSPARFSDDKTILRYFILEIPAHRAAKELEFSYKKIQKRYMGFRHCINNYMKKNNGHYSRSFLCYAKKRLKKYHGISKKYHDLYLKELEFRYNYKRSNIYDLLAEIYFGPFFAKN